MKIFGTDYDGVIINIEPQKAAAFGSLMHKYWGVDKKEAVNQWFIGAGTSRRSKFDYFYEKQYFKKLSNKEYQKIELEYSTFLKKKYYPTVQKMPYANEFLDFIRSHFDYTFVSSGVPYDEIHYLVKLNGLTPYFDSIYGTNEIYKSKSDHFKEILKDRKPDIFIFTADGAEDMRVAKKFNTTCIGLPTNVSEDLLVKAGANYICKDLKESQIIISKLLS